MTRPEDYRQFLEAKMRLASRDDLGVDASAINPALKPVTQAIAQWMLRGGRRALFAKFGMHKTATQIEVIRQCGIALGGPGLIVLPLGVRHTFRQDSERFFTGDHAAPVKFIRRASEIDWERRETGFVTHLANYETVRDGKLDPKLFCAASLDEASILRGFGGTKTFREFMKFFDGMRAKFVATATPSPNDYIELLAYAAFLEIMEVGEGKTRFFKRDSEKADRLTLHPHKEEEFWLWVASWALFVDRPSDLGFSDEGYELPPLDIRWHEIPADHSRAQPEKSGQHRLFHETSGSVITAAKEKRDSLKARIAKLKEIRAEEPGAHRIIWHTLEAERVAIEKAFPGVRTLYGAQDDETKEELITGFQDGAFAELGAKPVMVGSGPNFQHHCRWAVFLGIDDKFNDLIQAIHRLQRFGQPCTVRLDLIYTEAERPTRRNIERKWKQYEEQQKRMREIVREYGLSEAAMAERLKRSLGVERIEVKGETYRLVNNDCVEETRRMESGSVQLVVTSIPFSTQYEYTPSYNDFGHTDDDRHFWQQMDYLTPELLRVLEPGRVAAIHVKDRITPGGINGFGFQTVSPFSDDCVAHFRRHGFAFLARKTIVTDVVRENNQTYRLGWTEQCKDGSRMGAGLPEYLLLFRKPPSDRSNGYADRPVVKAKKVWDQNAGEPEEALPAWDEANEIPIELDEAREAALEARMNAEKEGWTAENIAAIAEADKRYSEALAHQPRRMGAWHNPEGYSRARWQLDAHGFQRSSGDRHLTADELKGLDARSVYRVFRDFSLNTVYDFEHHVRIGEGLEVTGSLPPTFMLLPPQSWHEDVWSDVTRMLTLNGSQHAKGRELHLCPLQFDIVDRAIVQFSMEGETVYDPFGGLMTVPYRALKLKRKGIGCELNPRYFLDGCAYVEAAAREMTTPSLLDFLKAEEEAATGAEIGEGAAVPRPGGSGRLA